MISIQTGMLVLLGFFIASLVWLLLASAFWSRAVRLTTERLKRSMPISEADIRADRDRLRAEHALKVHALDKRLDQAKLERAKHLIEINRRDARISALETEIVTIRAELEEHQNARRVLEQTVADRLPRLEGRLLEAKRLLSVRDREVAELTHNTTRHMMALEEAAAINAQKNAEIERLNAALVARGGRSRRSDARSDSEVAQQAELESLRATTREQAGLIDRLQRRLSEGHGFPKPVSVTANSDLADLDILQDTATGADPASSRSATPPAKPADKTQDMRELQARIDTQAGEISRLKAEIAALEQKKTAVGLKDRLASGSAEANAEREAATIAKLRAELAAANERLARQATHFMEEMRRLSDPASDAGGQTRRPGRSSEARKLADRVALVRPALAEKARALASSSPEHVPGHVNGGGAPATNGHHPERAPAGDSLKTPEPALAVAGSDTPPAPQMPQTAAIPQERRKLRLLDRITSLSKS